MHNSWNSPFELNFKVLKNRNLKVKNTLLRLRIEGLEPGEMGR